MITPSTKKEKENKGMKIKKNNTIYSIINISSSYDSIPKSEADAYTFSMSGVDPFTSSRAEVKALTKTVAFQLAHKGIRVYFDGIITMSKCEVNINNSSFLPLITGSV
jgi:hypothetical protein